MKGKREKAPKDPSPVFPAPLLQQVNPMLVFLRLGLPRVWQALVLKVRVRDPVRALRAWVVGEAKAPALPLA